MHLPEPGDVFRGFRIESELGQGGFATVFAARRLADGGICALKVLKPDHGTEYRPDTRARFKREVAILASLRSPHTVQMLEHGVRDDGLMYMVFEHLGGQDLSDILEARGRLTAAECNPILRQVLLSLQEAHNLGLLHRDLKPQNIRIIDQPGAPPIVKLMDFGIARSTDDGHPSITATGELIGTPRYMSPEQLTGRPLAAGSDIYSLGMVAVEMLAGRGALAGNRLGEQIDRMMSGFAFSVGQTPGTHAHLPAVIQRMTQRKPEARFASAAAVLHALDGSSDPQSAAREVELAAPATQRNQIMVAALAVSLALAATAIWVFRPTSREAPPQDVRRRAPIPPVPATPSPEVAQLVAPDVGGELVDVAPEWPYPALLAGRKRCQRTEPPSRERVFDERVSHIPANYDPGYPHPVVILLQADDDTRPAYFLERSGFRSLADKEKFVVIALDGGTYGWRSLSAAVRDLRDAIDEASATACIDPDRIYLVANGKSGRTAIAASCEEFLAGIAVNNFLPRTLDRAYWCDKQTRLMWLVPTEGLAEPLDGKPGLCARKGSMGWSAFRAAWRERNECTAEKPPRTEIVGGACEDWSCETPFRSCELVGQGGWPGTRAHGKSLCEEKPPRGDIAPDVWGFFTREPG